MHYLCITRCVWNVKSIGIENIKALVYHSQKMLWWLFLLLFIFCHYPTQKPTLNPNPIQANRLWRPFLQLSVNSAASSQFQSKQDRRRAEQGSQGLREKRRSRLGPRERRRVGLRKRRRSVRGLREKQKDFQKDNEREVGAKREKKENEREKRRSTEGRVSIERIKRREWSRQHGGGTNILFPYLFIYNLSLNFNES